uniref:Lipoprotein n=1 Tax=Dechloromonas aromatica (strain RCB) TaxID=159087 RepID=Q47FI1_DECAR
MKQQKMGLVALTTAAVLSMTLAGCKDEPSSGDIKDNLKAMVSDCPLIKVSGVEKLNGRPGSTPDSYYVSAKYTLSYTPPKEMEKILDEAVEAVKLHNAEIDQGHVEALRQRNIEASAELEKLKGEMESARTYLECRANDRNCLAEFTKATGCFISADLRDCIGEINSVSDRRYTGQIDKLEQEIRQNEDALYKLKPEPLPTNFNLRGKFYEIFEKQCRVEGRYQRGGPAQLDRNSVFLSDFSAG